MKPTLSLMIIPDTLAHVDGHPIVTRTYSIFRDTETGNPLLARSKESSLHLEVIKDPNYFGYITFELPDRLFSYTPNEKNQLSGDEVEQVIEFLSHLRENPTLWTVS
ncbi:hypothetical protein FFF34_003265 [Inquilinus sp. KBS0705]|nr:hypothetical protein FFF34_003265 [Inquilinus sp. KBS0705]